MSTQPVGLSEQLAPKQVMRVRLGAADLAIWRSTLGVVSAWENRCPHRGMRLSHGFVRGESLACAYHGWHYDCSGQCRSIPAHPELQPPSSIRVCRFDIKEYGGLLWVNTDGPAKPVELPENLTAVRSLTFNCNLEQAEAAFCKVQMAGDTAVVPVGTMISEQPKVLSYSTPESTGDIWVAFQPADLFTTVCHVLATDNTSGMGLISVSRLCESARRGAEKLQARATSTEY